MKNKEIDPKFKSLLDELRLVPPRDKGMEFRGKANFLKQAEVMRLAVSRKQEARHNGWIFTLFPAFPRKELTPMWNTLMAIVLAVAAFFGGTATTVSAAQGSLPNQSLYPVKTWSEDSLLLLTGSPLMRLNYELDFTDRRIAEMASLVSAGNPVPERVVTRLQNELENALGLAAGMDDPQMLPELEQIRLRAETQLQTMNRLMAGAPQSDQPILLQANARIQEQVRLCTLGETDPGGFRLQVRQHQPYQGDSELETPAPGNGSQNPSGTPTPAENGYGPGPGNGPQNSDSTPMPANNGNSSPGSGAGSGSDGNQPSGTPVQHGPSPEKSPQSGGSGNKP
jgi:hypothetical protein